MQTHFEEALSVRDRTIEATKLVLRSARNKSAPGKMTRETIMKYSTRVSYQVRELFVSVFCSDAWLELQFKASGAGHGSGRRVGLSSRLVVTCEPPAEVVVVFVIGNCCFCCQRLVLVVFLFCNLIRPRRGH